MDREGQPDGAGVDQWGRSLAQQNEAVSSFRDRLSEIGVRSNGDYYTLLRFIRARDYNLDKALTMYKQHLRWREENSVDRILEDFVFEEREQYLKAYPMGYYNTDKSGRPLSIQHLGQINPKRIREVTTPERMLMFHVQEYERLLRRIMPACSLVHGRHIDKMFVIMDATGVTLGSLSGEVRKTVSSISSVMQDHYPETLAKTLIINAPFVFVGLWNIIKPMLAPRTVEKVTVLGTNYMQELTKYVDIDSIPSFLGGNCPSNLLDDPGPWNAVQIADFESPASHAPELEPNVAEESDGVESIETQKPDLHMEGQSLDGHGRAEPPSVEGTASTGDGSAAPLALAPHMEERSFDGHGSVEPPALAPNVQVLLSDGRGSVEPPALGPCVEEPAYHVDNSVQSRTSEPHVEQLSDGHGSVELAASALCVAEPSFDMGGSIIEPQESETIVEEISSDAGDSQQPCAIESHVEEPSSDRDGSAQPRALELNVEDLESLRDASVKPETLEPHVEELSSDRHRSVESRREIKPHVEEPPSDGEESVAQETGAGVAVAESAERHALGTPEASITGPIERDEPERSANSSSPSEPALEAIGYGMGTALFLFMCVLVLIIGGFTFAIDQIRGRFGREKLTQVARSSGAEQIPSKQSSTSTEGPAEVFDDQPSSSS